MNKYRQYNLNELYAIQEFITEKLVDNTKQYREELEQIAEALDEKYQELDNYFRSYNEWKRITDSFTNY